MKRPKKNRLIQKGKNKTNQTLQQSKKKTLQKNFKPKSARQITIIVTLLYLIGGSILAYPFVSQALYKHAQKQAVREYQKSVVSQDKIKEEMQKYNEQLQSESGNIDYVIEAERDLLTDGARRKKQSLGPIIGVLEIPKIRVELPIYDGTNEDQISHGAGLMQGTSLPYGGKGTHSVLTSHRGLPAAKLFTDLPKLDSGDMFFIKVGSEIHEYEVDQIKVIAPTDFSDLGIVEDQDYVTLLTCTPYMINTHRLLVRGKRVTPFKLQDYQQAVKKGRWHRLFKVLQYAAVILFVLALFYVYSRRQKKKKKQQRRELAIERIQRRKEKRALAAQRIQMKKELRRQQRMKKQQVSTSTVNKPTKRKKNKKQR